MNPFWKFSHLLALLALLLSRPFNACAATNDLAKFPGTVVDPQGHPVAGASVDGYQYPMRTGSFDLEAKQHAVTDGQGTFEFSTFQGQGVVLVTKAGMAPVWRNLYSAGPEAQKFVLGASAPLAGRVVDAAGQPVADAEVWVSSALNQDQNDLGQPNFLFGKMAHGLFSTRTLADGTFRIENFPAAAKASLAVKKNGQAMRQNAKPARFDGLPYHAGQEDITLTLDPAGRVTGKVVARGTGQPLAFVAVALAPATPGIQDAFGTGTIASAPDGSFEIPDVSAGAYRVMAEFTNEPIADWVAEPVQVTVAAGQTVSGVQIQAHRGGVVAVTVRGKKNHALLADADVTVNSLDFSYASSTGTNGVALFRLPPGQFNVFVNQPDRSTAQTDAAVTEGQTNQVTIELGESFKVSGMVRNPAGAPVAGASVGVFPDYGWGGGRGGVTTDANGRYALSWQLPAWAGMRNQTLYLVVRQVDQNLAAMQELNETTTNLDLTLTPAMSVSGQVQDARGNAITNVMAYITLHQENSSFGITRQSVRADGQGRIQARALPAGERYGWNVSAPGYGSGHQEMGAADPKAAHYDFPPLILKLADRKLAGRVWGADGQPAAGVQVWMNGEDQPYGNTTTDADGRFAYDAVCAGPISVSASGNGHSASAEAMGGDTNVVIRLNASNNQVMQATPQTLTGHVFDASGDHVSGALVVVTPSWGPINSARTDANGDYSVDWQLQPGMPAAKYFVIARAVERNLAAIAAIDTNSTHVGLRLEPGFSISGTVQDGQGTPLLHAKVNLNIMAGNMGGLLAYEPVKLDSQGAFTIPALPMGQQYSVFVSAKGYGSVHKSIGKNQSQTNHLQLSLFKLRPADRPLAGKVLDAHGQPVPGAQVNLNGDGQPNGHARTDENGYFKFTVCGGPIQVFAWSQAGSVGNNSGSVQASGGDVNVVVKLGVRQRQGPPPVVVRDIPLQPQAWTASALLGWPARHKTGALILLALQATLLLGTCGGIFWFTRKRG